MFAIRRKNDGLFYNSSTINWVLLEKARIFKRRRDIDSFLRYNCVRFYPRDKISIIGISSFIDREHIITSPDEFEIVELEIKVKK